MTLRLFSDCGSNQKYGQFSKLFLAPQPPAYISCVVESPPVLFHGTEQDSTGALLSGLLYINVVERPVVVSGFMASLSLQLTNRRPQKKSCSECRHWTSELKSWTFLVAPTRLPTGQHQFPFCSLLEGSHPASVDTSLVSISYQFKATAIVVDSDNETSCHPIRFERTIMVNRSIPESLYPSRSVRCVNTHINIRTQHDRIICPNGTNQLTLKLNGLKRCGDTGMGSSLWVVRTVAWTLNEHITTNFAACDIHSNLAVEEFNGADMHRDVRSLGSGHLINGWKADYSGTDGSLELVLEYGVAKPQQARYACDLKSDSQVEISHSLCISITMSEQSTLDAVPLAAGRRGFNCMVKMALPVILTEPGDFVHSWENEFLPIYQDKSQSPPGYHW